MGTQFTRDGHVLSEAVSALQKCVRRQWAAEAVYFGLEIWDRYPHYLMRRLPVIVTEDIGLADTLLVEEVLALCGSYQGLLARAPWLDGEGPVAVLLRAMAAAPKSRETDDFVHHTLRDLRLGRLDPNAERSFGEMAVELGELLDVGQEQDAFALAIRMNNGYAGWLWDALVSYAALRVDDAHVASTIAHLRTAVRASMEHHNHYTAIYLAFGVLLLARSDKGGRLEGMLAEQRERRGQRGRVEIPDVALDGHTGRGRAKGRGLAYFISESSKLVGEAYPSRYLFYDPEFGTASVLADNVTRVGDEYAVSTAKQRGGAAGSAPAAPPRDRARGPAPQGGLFD